MKYIRDEVVIGRDTTITFPYNYARYIVKIDRIGIDRFGNYFVVTKAWDDYLDEKTWLKERGTQLQAMRNCGYSV